MKIAVNTRFLLKRGLEGYGWYTYEVFSRMCRLFPDDEYLFLFDRPYDSRFLFEENVRAKVIPPPARHPLLFTTWFEFSIPLILNQYKPDLFISPDGFCSLRYKGRTMLVIHDLAYLYFPESIPANQLQYYRKYMPLFIRRADHIIAISEATANDIERVGGQKARDKTTVVYNGTRNTFKPLHAEEVKGVRKKWSGNRPYFLFVGALQPRKNIVRLILAYEKFRSQTEQSIPLILVGRMAWNSDELKETIQHSIYFQDIILTGHVEETDIRLLVGAALAQVYISLMEGFGLPIVEAFQAGVPVITSRLSSMEEIGENAALLVSPYDENEIAEAMLSILNNEEKRTAHIQAGLARAVQFDWDKTASEIHSIIIG